MRAVAQPQIARAGSTPLATTVRAGSPGWPGERSPPPLRELPRKGGWAAELGGACLVLLHQLLLVRLSLHPQQLHQLLDPQLHLLVPHARLLDEGRRHPA